MYVTNSSTFEASWSYLQGKKNSNISRKLATHSDDTIQKSDHKCNILSNLTLEAFTFLQVCN